MNNDELDRELKLVQLQRERLALEREIAFQGVGGEAKKIGKAIGRAAATPFIVFWDFLTQWWKAIFTIFLIVGCIGATVAFVKHYQEEKLRLAQERWDAKANADAEKECPSHACSYSAFDCAQSESMRRICTYEAWSRYAEKVPRPQEK